MSEHDELLRLRDRTHKLEKSVAALELLYRTLGTRVTTLEGQVAPLVDEDRIAEQVTLRLKARRAQLFSWPVKLGAAVAALAAVLNFALRLWQVAHG